MDETCYICLKPSEFFYGLSECDENNLKWVDKLRKCTYNLIMWDEQSFICKQCCKGLQVAYTFIKMCFVWQERKINLEQDKMCIAGDDFSFPDSTEALSNINKLEYMEEGSKIDLENSSVTILDNMKIESNPTSSSDVKSSKSSKNNVEPFEVLQIILDKQPKAKKTTEAKPEQQLTCEQCNMQFKKKFILTRHINTVHATEKAYNCDTCNQKFASKTYLKDHKKYHNANRSYICTFCGKGYITSSDLYHHEKSHYNKRAYKCLDCPKAFNTSSDLYKHKICMHTDKELWKYVCGICGKRFPIKTNVNAHVKMHTGEKNHSCHICPKKFVNNSALKRHVLTHSNVKSLKCEICRLEYKHAKSLEQHMNKVHSYKDVVFSCSFCQKGFKSSLKFQSHLQTHSELQNGNESILEDQNVLDF